MVSIHHLGRLSVDDIREWIFYLNARISEKDIYLTIFNGAATSLLVTALAALPPRL